MGWWKNLEREDKEIYEAIIGEMNREEWGLELIASENFVSPAVLEAVGSILTNKYAEGYPGRRYYGGCKFVDHVERVAMERAKKLFNVKFANVQPHSGSQANMAVYLALADPGETIMGMSLTHGGHLTHGASVNFSGRLFKVVHYGVNPETGLIDYDEVERMARREKPKIIIAGGSAYSRIIDFKRFREIADEIDAYLVVDMAHFAGLVAAGIYPNPVEYAHVVTSTTHKTLRGPRGGFILTNHEELAKKINKSVFPGIQGGPLMHVIAGKAVCFKEAMKEEFKEYQKRVVRNAIKLANEMMKRDFKVVSGGTDTHLFLVDLTKENVSGKAVEKALEKIGITVNKNTVPGEKRSPFITSGIRIGTPAVTTRGMGEKEMEEIAEILSIAIRNTDEESKFDERIVEGLSKRVRKLCEEFPLYRDKLEV